MFGSSTRIARREIGDVINFHLCGCESELRRGRDLVRFRYGNVGRVMEVVIALFAITFFCT